MDNNHSQRIVAFDSLFTTNHIQILKLLLGLMEPSIQGKLAVYIKFLELEYTLKLVAKHPSLSMSPTAASGCNSNITSLLDEISFFCAPADKEKLENIRNMYQSFTNLQEMMEMMELLKELSPEMFSQDGGGFDFSQMMGMTQGTDMSQMMDMMNMMQSMFASEDQTGKES